MLLYEEALRSGGLVDRDIRIQLASELNRVFRMVTEILPSEAFSALRFAADDVSNPDRRRGLAEDFLRGLETAGVAVSSEQAIQFFPGEVFGGAFARGQVFPISAYQEFQKISNAETELLASYWKQRASVLLDDQEFKVRFGKIMK